MDSRPELPFLAASGIAVAGSTMAHGKLPDLTRVMIGTIVCVLVASASGGTKVAPLVHAFGMLVLLVSVIAATNSVIQSKKKGKAND